jgi:hypothetical protein
VALPGDWLVSTIWFLLSTTLVGIVRWGMTASSCKMVKAVVFTRKQLCCPSAAALFGQLLPQWGGAVQFWMLPSVPEIVSGIHHLHCFGRLAYCPTSSLRLCAFSDLCWVLEAPLGSWFVIPLLLSAFMPLLSLLGAGGSSGNLAFCPACTLSLCCFTPISSLRVSCWEFGSLFPFSRADSAVHPHLCCWC